MQEIDPEQPPPPAKKQGSRFIKVMKISGGMAFLMMAALICLPYCLATDYARRHLVEGLTRELGTDVQIASYSIGWFSGLSLEGLVVENPGAIALRSERDSLLRLDRIDLNFNLASLIRGRIDFEATITGLDLHIIRDANSSSNLAHLVAKLRGSRSQISLDADEGDWREPGMRSRFLERIRLDLEIRDSKIRFSHVDHGLLEAVEAINIRLTKNFGYAELKLECAADFHRPDKPNRPGRIQILGKVDLGSEDLAEIEFHCLGLELNRYSAILEALLPPEQITKFSGQLRADCRMHLDPEHRLELGGLIEIEKPRFAGELFAGMDIASERWSLRPNIQARLTNDWDLQDADVSMLEVDLGFLQVQGTSKSRSGVEFTFKADLADLARQRGPAATELPITVGAAEGILAYNNGKLAISMDASDINGGKLHLDASIEPFADDGFPIHLTMDLKASEARADGISLLRYLVPIMAGSDSAGMVNFKSLVDLEVAIDGRYDPERHNSAVALLSALQGHGRLNLRGGTFMPADEIMRLFSLLGGREALELRDLTSEFTFDHGKIETSLLELNSKGRLLRMSGTTTLDGEIDYRIDASDLLKGHRDGEKILGYLGGEGVHAELTGTLDAPKLAMADLTELLHRASGKAIEQEIEKQAQKGLDRLLRKLFKKKK